jgi:hypothetical protein
VILDLIFIGLAITLEPVPLTAFILVLASERGVRKGAAFVLGWLLSLAVVIALTVLATDDTPPAPSTAPSLVVLAVKIAIGVGLLLVALRQYRRMGKPKKPRKTPRWQLGIDKMSPLYAVGLAALVQPWPLVAAGAATIVEAKLSSLADYGSLALFCRRDILDALPGGPCRLSSRTLTGAAWPPTRLDQHPPRSGDHHRERPTRILAHRKEQLCARRLIGTVTDGRGRANQR